MNSAIGEVWMTSNECVYLIVGTCNISNAKGGWLWDMRALHEPGYELPVGRQVMMHPEYLEEHLERVT